MTEEQKLKNRERVRAWKKANPEKVKTNKKKNWNATSRLKAKIAQRRFRAANRDACNQKASVYHRNRYKTDVLFKMRKILRSRIGAALSGRTPKAANTIALLGCTINELRTHIESLWKPGMSWDNYGLHGWHIDHLRPCISFDLSDPDQQRQCFHWSNLQPLWAEENWSKGG